VIVNDGSTDHTADVLRGLGLPADRFTYVEQANAGQSRLATRAVRLPRRRRAAA